jgi:hypothetical protein
MKGKITIDFKYDKDNSNEFAQEITMKKVTILHIASAISKLTALMEQCATPEDKARLANLVRTEHDEAIVVIKPLGDA